ncbi:DUF7322 domain-containing protein [Natronorubrum sulfidifaciens]|uniref:DUF7322 domain-containing protein n=1 Tax=Natronorubrum sulfidifaciens JCM 14089 TaxID=1230460 RepID=L9W1R7_9EURY|nr:hypothetical protein [Natronorubrum sulfidifaciens]ELY43395.1 hypothetical protein C495_13456 [Natronorubrum sulfidifaciens JCM 14089]
MGADRSEHEPDEYDPEAEFRDPDSDSITIPRVATEDAGSDLRSDLKSELEDDVDPEFSTADSDVDSELLTQFWALVLVVNAVVLAFALALLFLIFDGELTYSASLGAVGLALTGFAVRRYRTFKRTNDATADDADDDPTADDADDDLETPSDSSLETAEEASTDDERPPNST